MHVDLHTWTCHWPWRPPSWRHPMTHWSAPLVCPATSLGRHANATAAAWVTDVIDKSTCPDPVVAVAATPVVYHRKTAPSKGGRLDVRPDTRRSATLAFRPRHLGFCPVNTRELQRPSTDQTGFDVWFLPPADLAQIRLSCLVWLLASNDVLWLPLLFFFLNFFPATLSDSKQPFLVTNHWRGSLLLLLFLFLRPASSSPASFFSFSLLCCPIYPLLLFRYSASTRTSILASFALLTRRQSRLRPRIVYVVHGATLVTDCPGSSSFHFNQEGGQNKKKQEDKKTPRRK